MFAALLSLAKWPAVVIGLFAAWSAASLLRNYLIARKIGIPIRIIPIDHVNPIWFLIDGHVQPVVKKLFGESTFTRYNYRGWELFDRYYTHKELGDAYILVTPGRNWVYIASPEALTNIFHRRTDFPRCLELTEMLNVFGPNISTVDGALWKKQRKISASCFNDQNNEIVWAESLWLAQDMLNYWLREKRVTSVSHDTRTLSLHILSRAGFGKSFKFEGHSERQTGTLAVDYKDSLNAILENCVVIMALGPKFFANPWLPHKMRRLGEACATFQKYMTDTYEEEKNKIADGKAVGQRTLLSSLIRASFEDEDEGGLTEQQIYGNMFVFNFGGHDTTAITFTFVIYLLATQPSVQDWVSEELRRVLGDRNPKNWNYKQDFPQLKRTLALMYETLRLWTPVPVAKWTNGESQPLTVNGKTMLIPPRTMVIPSYASVQTDPKFWGDDSLVWRPSRWVTADTSPGAKTGAEALFSYQKSTFLGWSDGARDCPGKKFSQVEMVATLAVLLRDYRVDPVLLNGESLATAQERVANQIETDTRPVLLMQMLHPERSPLTWTKRD